MRTKVKGPIKKKRIQVWLFFQSLKTIAALRLVNYTCNGFIKLTPALDGKADQLKNHTTEGNWERKNVVHRTERMEKCNSRNLSS